MKQRLTYYNSIEELNIPKGKCVLIFGYGTGDTFNALLHLSRSPPLCSYEIVIKSPQKNLVLFMLDLFSRQPEAIHVVDYWKHDFSQIIGRLHESHSKARGIAPSLRQPDIIDCWVSPSFYQKIIPIEDGYINQLISAFKSKPPKTVIPDGSVMLFTTAGTNFSEYSVPWQSIVTTLKDRGLNNIYANISGNSNYGEEHVAGTTSLHIEHDELIRAVYQTKDLRIIGIRSGVLDILRFASAKALVLYQRNPAGIFKTCRFGLLRHNFDLIELICLDRSVEHQDLQLKYYASEFIGATI
jgi:hypothetical protein